MPGRLLNGRYRLGAVLGRGGMGTVWHATDEVLGRAVAVKELRLPPEVEEAERKRMITRTLREAKAIAAIRNRGVVTIYDVVDEGERPWIVMELIDGRSLADVIRAEGPMEPRRAAEIGLAILDVLRAAHDAGILHRDVKPSNVIIAEEDGRVVLTDFGIAKVEGDPSITSTGMLVGAPSYISPERARGQALGPPADMWSLGALLFCCVEGRPPYDAGGAIATLAAVMHDPVPAARSAGPLTGVINGLLTKDPKARLDEPGAREGLAGALAGAPARPEEEPEAGGGAERTLIFGAGAAAGAAGTESGTRPSPEAPEAPAAPGTAPSPATPPAAGEAPDARPTPVPVGALRASPPGPPGPGRPDAAGAGRRRLALIAGVVIVLLALLGAALASTLGDDGDGGSAGERSGDTQGQGGGGEDPSQQPGGEEPTPRDEGTAQEDPPAESPTAPTSPPEEEDEGDDEGDGDTPPGTGLENDPDATLPGTPAGYATVEDERFRFRMSLPQGWQRIDIAGANSGGIYADPDGGLFRVQVDFTDAPGDDAAQAWRDQEPGVRSRSRDYERISIEEIEWRGYPTVADWTFERTQDGRVRVLDRGFRVDDDAGYAIMITCPAEEWDEEECRTLRETAFDTFQPLD
ncbi:serine/threonine-protein kinase [Streptomyces sp. DSM 44917]|uniref:non-specific serine/threonine protein kinase n=1 Tax=Streptomyces boetiae TaxID=3075541 RepID=A0ABU2LAC3_9ACTN|nr:serine/threonine-protein kinase [Streptomyces sp. DSM 44917]MDT0308525.1 serine/threonine-protein kinase [Streptomyces sp. DSM 44917]